MSLLERKNIEIIRGTGVDLVGLDGLKVLENANFEFVSGQAYRLNGKLGSCSEFLKMLGFLDVKSSGSIFVNNDNISEMSFEEFSPYRLNIGYTFDHGGLLNNKTIRDNILLPLQYHNELTSEESTERVEALLDHFDLQEFGGLRPAMTPGYVRKLACVLRSLALDPQILAMDGPTTAVDKVRATKLVDYIAEKIQSGKLKMVFFSSTYEFGFESWQPKDVSIENKQVSEYVFGEVAA